MRHLVDHTIYSVISQTYKEWELIIVDDSSIDGTYEHINKKYSNNPKIKILRTNINKGAGVARNIGLDYASGQFISFLDSDDIWDHQKLERQLKFMIKNDAPISHTGFSYINEEGAAQRGRIVVSNLLDFKKFMKTTEIGTSTAMIDLTKVGKIFFSNRRTRQDFILWRDLLYKGFVSHGLKEDLVKYRIRKDQISGNKLKMLQVTSKLYLHFDKIPLHTRIYYFTSYVVHAFIKRIRN